MGFIAVPHGCSKSQGPESLSRHDFPRPQSWQSAAFNGNEGSASPAWKCQCDLVFAKMSRRLTRWRPNSAEDGLISRSVRILLLTCSIRFTDGQVNAELGGRGYGNCTRFR